MRAAVLGNEEEVLFTKIEIESQRLFPVISKHFDNTNRLCTESHDISA
jgi:hypothetical protein